MVVAWLLIQVTETIFPLFGFDDTPARIAVIVLAIGFFPALIFAWAFEITPEGLKKESDVDRTQSLTPHTGKKLDRMIMVVLALALGYFAFDKFVLDPQRETEQLATLEELKTTEVQQARQDGRTEALVESYGEKSIAVLPFVNMSSDVEQEYFSDGLSEELLNLLARIPELRVISRSSAFSYKGKDINLAQVAEELNVAHILEGSVRKAGRQVRITVQLIEARSDTHLWSETYDTTLANIFAVQDEIAEKIVDSLSVLLLKATPKVKNVDPAAYELFLKGTFLANKVGREDLERGVDLLEQSTRVNSSYAPAWTNLGTAYRNQANYGYRDMHEGTAQARKAIERALALDPLLADAWAQLGTIHLSYDWDFDAADVAIQRALELGPNQLFVLSSAAKLDVALGHFDEAVKLRRKSLSLAPLSLFTRLMLGWDLLFGGRTVEAESSLRQLIELDSQYPIAHCLLGQVLLLEGKPDEALIEMNLESQEEWKHFGIVLALESLGRHEEAAAATDSFIEQYGQVWFYQTAVIYAYRNEADAAFEWLDRGYEEQDGGMVLLSGDPFLARIHDDSRWNTLLDKMGLAK